MTRAGFPHSDTPGSQLGCQLPRAYRRLLRPSSALDAKASTMCPSQLVTQTLNKENTQQIKTAKTKHSRSLERLEKSRWHGESTATRCSRPLSSYEDPCPPTRGTPATPAPCQGGQSRQGHRACGDRPDPSGPNSVSGPAAVSWCLVPRPVPLGGVGSTEATGARSWSFVDDSTSEHHRCRPVVRWACGVCAP